MCLRGEKEKEKEKEKEGGRRKEEGGRRKEKEKEKEEGGRRRRKEEGGRRKEEGEGEASLPPPGERSEMVMLMVMVATLTRPTAACPSVKRGDCVEEGVSGVKERREVCVCVCGGGIFFFVVQRRAC